MALLTIEMIEEIRKVTEKYTLLEALRLARLSAESKYGIAWNDLTEISKFELVFDILGNNKR